MGKYIRTFIAIIVLLSLVLLAKNKVAWAATPASADNQTSPAQAELSASFDEDDDCKEITHKNKDKCKDKHKHKCKDKHHDCGTVKPPKDHHKICHEEHKSVGGVVVVDVKKLPDKECVEASTKSPDPSVDKLPPDSGKVVSDVLTLTMSSSETKVSICFAASPLQKKVNILSSSTGSWLAIKTDVNQGMACADVPSAGKFVLVAQ
jgi:hypothetical protein